MAQKEKPSMLERLQTIDRRWIFFFIMLSVVIPMAFDLTIDQVATPEVQAIYERIEDLPPHSNVLLPFDFGPESEPELQPMADGFVRHLCRRKQKLYFMCLWPTGQAQTLKTVNEVLEREFSDYRYGRDYVMLGFKPGGQGVIQVVVTDFRTLYQSDVKGTPIDEIPMMQNVRGLKDMDLILNVSGGFPGLKEWVQFGADRTGVPIAGGVTAVMAPLLYPYYPGQLSGIMGGLKAAAEYESLLIEGYPEAYGTDTQRFAAIRRMGPQTLAHMVIILFLVVGNIAYFATRGSGGGRLKSLEK